MWCGNVDKIPVHLPKGGRFAQSLLYSWSVKITLQSLLETEQSYVSCLGTLLACNLR
jgi:hypothetical protein